MNKIINIIIGINVIFCMIFIPFSVCIAEDNPVVSYYTYQEDCALPDEIYIPLFIHEVQLPKSYYQYADITVEDESIIEVDDTNGAVTVKKNGTTKMFIQFLDDPTFGNNCFTYTVYVIPAKIKWKELEYDKYEYDLDKRFVYWSLEVDLIDKIDSGPSATYKDASRYYEVLKEITRNMVNVKSSNPEVCDILVSDIDVYEGIHFGEKQMRVFANFLKPGKTELTFSVSESEYFEPLEKKITLIVHEDKTTETSTTEEIVTEAPTTKEPVTEEPTIKEPVTEAPTTEEPTTEEPITEEPVTEESTTEEPVTEELTTEEPVTEELTTEELVTDVPTSKEHIETIKETETNKEAAVFTDNTSGNSGLKKSLIIIFAVIIVLLFGFFVFIFTKQQILIKKIRMQDVETPVSPEIIGEETDGERTELSMYTETKISDN